MQLPWFIIVTVLAGLSSAFPGKFGKGCLRDDKAKEIIDTYAILISRLVTGAEFNKTADALLAPDFFTQSNSINGEIRKPVSIPW